MGLRQPMILPVYLEGIPRSGLRLNLSIPIGCKNIHGLLITLFGQKN